MDLFRTADFRTAEKTVRIHVELHLRTAGLQVNSVAAGADVCPSSVSVYYSLALMENARCQRCRRRRLRTDVRPHLLLQQLMGGDSDAVRRLDVCVDVRRRLDGFSDAR